MRPNAVVFIATEIDADKRSALSAGLAFDTAVDSVSQAACELLASLTTEAKLRDRDIEAAKARQRAAKRFGSTGVNR